MALLPLRVSLAPNPTIRCCAHLVMRVGRISGYIILKNFSFDHKNVFSLAIATFIRDINAYIDLPVEFISLDM